MRSNSLNVKLKKKEVELKQHEQEIADQHELHELTVKELELTKSAHKIAQEEVQQYKIKVWRILVSVNLSLNTMDHLINNSSFHLLYQI